MFTLNRKLQLRRYFIDAAKKLLAINNLSIRKTLDSAFDDQARLLDGFNDVAIIDAGAHIGSAANAYRFFFPRSRIVCIEPLEDLAVALRHSLGDTEVLQCALSESDGEMPFNRLAFSATSSLLLPDLEKGPKAFGDLVQPESTILTPVRSLDSLCSELGLDHVHILKLDIQGAELSALRGAQKLLNEKRISLIYCEVSFQPCYLDQPLFGDIFSHLIAAGYLFHSIFNAEFCGVTGRIRQADAIFVCPFLSTRSSHLLRESMNI